MRRKNYQVYLIKSKMPVEISRLRVQRAVYEQTSGLDRPTGTDPWGAYYVTKCTAPE